MKKKLIFIFFAAFTVAVLWAGQAEKKNKKLSINKRMEKLFFEWDRLDRPGGAVIVVMDGKVVFKKAYGLASMEHNIHVTPKTLFDVVSIAKPFTGMAIAMLEIQGKLLLDEDIRKHIPELPDFGKTITIRHLLYHSSGIWDWSNVLMAAGWRPGDVITMDQILKMVKRQKKLQFDPGTKYQISNTNYNLLAEIAKRVTGQSFRDWTRENIFRPLSMRKSLVRDRYGEPVENQAFAYDYVRMRGYQKGGDNLSTVGSHCLFSSVEDIGKWLINLKTGKVGGNTVIKKMFSPGVLNNGKKIDYAYGWSIDTYKGLKRFSASGYRGGFNSSLQYFPQYRFGVVVLSNWISSWVYPVYTASSVADIYLEAHLKKPKTSATKEKAVEIKPDPALYDQYTGDYRWQPGYVVNILREKDRLVLQTPQKRKFQLLPQSKTKFKLSVADYMFTFQNSKDGKVIQILIQQSEGEDIIAQKIKIVKPTPSELMEFTGTYHCTELDIRYSIILQDNKLLITNLRLSDILLEPESQDHFTTDFPAYPMVEFIRDKQNKVSGFKMDGLQIIFKKI